MNEVLLAKKLAREEARRRVLEQMIEDKTRDLFLANDELKRANDGLTDLYKIMPSALLCVDPKGTIQSANMATCNLLGYEEQVLVGRPVDCVSQALSGLLDSTAEFIGVESRRSEDAWCSADGTQIPVLVSAAIHRDSSGEVLSAVFLGVDLRERQRLEIELRHAQKLESVGQLAAGVAHEINTPMQFIGDNVHFLSDAVQDMFRLIEVYEKVREHGISDAALREELSEADEDADLEYLRERMPRAFERTLMGVERVSKIVAAMKAFSHPENEKVPTDLNKAIENTLAVACNEYKYVSDIELDLGAIPAVVCAPGDINQVLLNLVVNAAHAIGEVHDGSASRGLIRIRTSQENERVTVAVCDNGPGVPEDIRHRIFDPFFTTKEVGKGTGQGLAFVHNIIADKHAGEIRVEPSEGAGATFVFSLPINPSASSRGRAT